MRTVPAVFVLFSVLFAFAISQRAIDNERKAIISSKKGNRRNSVTLEKRRWRGKMYSKLRKDESPPPTNNQLSPLQYDVTTPSPDGSTPAAGGGAAGQPTPGAGAPPSGAQPPPSGATASGQQPQVQYPYRQSQFGQPYGPNPYVQNQYGQNPYGQQSFGQQPFGQQPFGQQQLGQQQPPFSPLNGNKPPKGAPPPPPGGTGGGCGTATVCGTFSISKEDPSSVLSPPPVPVMQPQLQQPCMPQMQGCGAAPPPVCPSICSKKCMVTCPRNCCPESAIPGSQGDVTDSESHGSDSSSKECPAVCWVYCAHECPHNCCGPGGARRSYIARPREFRASQLTPPAIFAIEKEAGDLKRH